MIKTATYKLMITLLTPMLGSSTVNPKDPGSLLAPDQAGEA
jgi:hypothetical protein